MKAGDTNKLDGATDDEESPADQMIVCSIIYNMQF